ncbi:MAG: polysaccharide biosynthesis C-terminal domain-containing protein [Candidatus Aenigmarchaeota archaeon]|nr:polysaccharide biosynthesis C-terminal domain-containing protein [Candidatus Aenigmarchaeota archaeon]
MSLGNATKIISNTFYLFLDWLALTFGGYLFWIIIGKSLSPAEIGRFSTIFSVSMFLVGFVGLGINAAMMKLFPYYEKKNERTRIAGTFWWSVKTTVVSSLVFGGVLWLSSPIISSVISITRYDVFLIFLIIFATNLVYITNSYLYGLQRIKLIFTTDLVFSFSKIAATFPLVVLGLGYLGPIYGLLFSSFVILASRYKTLPRGGGPVEKKEIWFYSLPILVSTAGTVFVNQGSILILSIISSTVSVGLFSLMFFLTSPVKMIPQLISSGTFPLTSQQSEKYEKDSMNRIFYYGIRYSFLFSVPVLVILTAFPEEIILLFSSEQFVQVAGIAPILAAAYLLVGMSTVLINTLYATGRVNETRNSTLIGGFVNLVFSLTLIPLYGLYGAAFAFLASGFSMAIYSGAKVKKKLSLIFPLRDIFRITFAAVALYFFVVYSSSLTDIWLITSLLGLLVYFIILLESRFFKETDIRMISYIKSKFPKLLQPIFDRILNLISRFSD